jgi:glycerol transport system permease protein
VWRAIRVVFIALLIVATLFPIHSLLVVSLESFRRFTDYYDYASWQPWPRRFTWFHYIALTREQWPLSIRNSIVITLGNTVICLLLAIPAAYMFTRVRFRFDRWLFFWLMLNRVSPPGIFMVPFYIIYNAIGLYDTLLGVMIAHTVFNLPMAIWILTGFMRDIPRSVDESAFIDGFSTWGFWRRIYIPLLLPAIGVTAFFLWMFSFTDVLLARSVSLFHSYTLTVNLLRYTGSGPVPPQAASAGIISIIPGLIMLFFIRRYIAKGFTLGWGTQR